MSDDSDHDRVVRTVEAAEGGGRVDVPPEWVGARVEVVRTGPGEPDRADYALAAADEAAAFARAVDGERHAGPDVVDHLARAAADPATFYVGLADDGAGAYHATVDRAALAEGLVVLDDGDPRASALLGTLAWQAVAGGAAGAVFARESPTAERFARALPDDRAANLQVVGADGRSVNLIDTAVPPSSAAFFDAVDAVTDALVSLLVVADPQLRDAIREFVMAAASHDGTTLADLRELVRHGTVGDDADVPAWVPEESPDLLDRVEGVDEEALGWLLDSMAPLLREPARSLLADPDPDVSPVEVVRSCAPLVVQVGDRYGVDTWATVGRALVHALWGAAREFVEGGADHPFYLVGDAFGPVLGAEANLDRLFARLDRTPVAPLLGVDPGTLEDDAWADLASAAGVHATFGLVDAHARERAAALTGLDADQFAALPAGGFWLTGADDPRRHLGYHPVAPERPREDLDWVP
jgi:hypothetical protein